MKTIKFIAVIVMAALSVTLTSCTKEEGFSGKATIKGAVTYPGGTASGAVVSISFGATAETATFDYSTVTGADGNYSFEALSTGDYYVDATYSDALGNTFESGGALVTIGSTKSEVTVDLDLQ